MKVVQDNKMIQKMVYHTFVSWCGGELWVDQKEKSVLTFVMYHRSLIYTHFLIDVN